MSNQDPNRPFQPIRIFFWSLNPIRMLLGCLRPIRLQLRSTRDWAFRLRMQISEALGETLCVYFEIELTILFMFVWIGVHVWMWVCACLSVCVRACIVWLFVTICKWSKWLSIQKMCNIWKWLSTYTYSLDVAIAINYFILFFTFFIFFQKKRMLLPHVKAQSLLHYPPLDGSRAVVSGRSAPCWNRTHVFFVWKFSE